MHTSPLSPHKQPLSSYGVALCVAIRSSATEAFAHELNRICTTNGVPKLVVYELSRESAAYAAACTEGVISCSIFYDEAAAKLGAVVRETLAEEALSFPPSLTISIPRAHHCDSIILLLSLLPHVRETLLITDDEDDETTRLAHICRGRIEERSKSKTHQPEPLQKKLAILPSKRDAVPLTIKREMPQTDLVILLGKHHSPLYLEELASLCQHSETLFVTLDSRGITHGAGFTLGEESDESAHAVFAFIKLLSEGGTLPHTYEPAFSVRFNTENLRLQGLNLSTYAPLLSFLQSTRTVAPRPDERIAARMRLERIPLE